MLLSSRLALLALSVVIHVANASVITPENRAEGGFGVEYSFLQDFSPVYPNKRDEPTDFLLSEPNCMPPPEACRDDDIVPGLAVVKRGVDPSYFPSDVRWSREPYFYPVFQLTCNKSGGEEEEKVFFNSKLVPNEVTIDERFDERGIPEDETIVELEGVSSPNLTVTLKTFRVSKDNISLLTKHRTSIDLGIVSSFLRDYPSAVYLSIRVYSHRISVGLEPEVLKPSPTLLRNYNELPQDFEPVSYLQLVKKYGTGFRTGAAFGGQFESLNFLAESGEEEVLRYLSSATIPQLWRDLGGGGCDADSNNVHFRLHIMLTDSVTRGGGLGFCNFEDWANSVAEKPVLLPLRYSSINKITDLIDRKMVNPKTENVARIVDCEMNANYLRLAKYEVAVAATGETKPLSTFLLQQIDRQLDYVCPNGDFVQLLREAVRANRNQNLSRYWAKSPSVGKFYLLPELCMSLVGGRKGGLLEGEEVEFQLPESNNCVRFYEGSSCKGKSVKTTKKEAMVKEIRNAKSLSLC